MVDPNGFVINREPSRLQKVETWKPAPENIFDQKVDVVGGHRIVEHGQTKAYLGLKNPTQITAVVARKLQ